jgi:hypothetical protein
MRRFTQVLTIVLVLGVAAQTSRASWGDLDATFGFLGGVVDTNAASHYPYGLAGPTGRQNTSYRLSARERKETFLLASISVERSSRHIIWK